MHTNKTGFAGVGLLVSVLLLAIMLYVVLEYMGKSREIEDSIPTPTPAEMTSTVKEAQDVVNKINEQSQKQMEEIR